MMQTTLPSNYSTWGGVEYAKAKNRWIRYYEGRNTFNTHIEEIIEKVNENINEKYDNFIENMVRYTTLAEGMIEGAIAPDQVSIRLHDDVEEKITKNIMSYIKKGETLGDEEFDTLIDRILLLLKEITPNYPEWKIADNTVEEENRQNFVIIDTEEENNMKQPLSEEEIQSYRKYGMMVDIEEVFGKGEYGIKKTFIPPEEVDAYIEKYGCCQYNSVKKDMPMIKKGELHMDSTKLNFFDELEKKGIKISEQQREQINRRLSKILNYEPRIGVFGKTGVGKSSLCNALFGKDVCPISDIEACTRNTKEVIINLGGSKGIKLIDVPGVGENSKRDEEYGKLYNNLLPELDLVLWVIKADDRAMASDEKFYKNIVKPHIEEGKPFFFVLNQVDKIEPFREWDEKKKEPSPNQFQNIHRKIDDLARIFDIASSRIIPISAAQGQEYNLTELVDEIIRGLPKEKKITTFKAIDDQFKSEKTTKAVKRSLGDMIVEVVSDVAGKVIDIGGEFIDKIVDIVDTGKGFVSKIVHFFRFW